MARRRVAAGTVLSSSLTERRKTFSHELMRVRRHPTEPGIHDLRVATRRLLATVDLCGVIAGAEQVRPARVLLRRLLKNLNHVRDLQVLLLANRPLVNIHPGLRAYVSGMRVRERRAVRDASRRVERFDDVALNRLLDVVMRELEMLLVRPGAESAVRSAALGALASATLVVMRRHANIATGDASTIHRLRVSYKKLRYLTEMLSPLLPGLKKPLFKSMNGYQTLMGAVQDAEVITASLDDFARHDRTSSMQVLPARQYWAAEQRKRKAALLASTGPPALYSTVIRDQSR